MYMKNNELQETREAFVQSIAEGNMYLTIGQHGFVQVRTTEFFIASKLVQQLKATSDLRSVNIEHCDLREEGDGYVFRLTERQYDGLFGDGSYYELVSRYQEIEIETNQLRDLFDIAVQAQDPDKFALLITQYTPFALGQAALQELDGQNLLHIVMLCQPIENLSMLLKRIDPDTRDTVINTKFFGQSALEFAAAENCRTQFAACYELLSSKAQAELRAALAAKSSTASLTFFGGTKSIDQLMQVLAASQAITENLVIRL